MTAPSFAKIESSWDLLSNSASNLTPESSPDGEYIAFTGDNDPVIQSWDSANAYQSPPIPRILTTSGRRIESRYYTFTAREKLSLVVLQSESSKSCWTDSFGPTTSHHPKGGGEAGPRTDCQPVHPLPSHCRIGFGSTKRVDNVSPP